MNNSIVGQKYWNNIYKNLELRYNFQNVLFRDVFDKYLRHGGTCFEVGCYPGNFLIYFSQRFGYTVSGIDTTMFVSTRMSEHLLAHGANIGELYCEDFLNFTPKDQYDVVCSFGFIEHFLNYDYIIKKHIDLLKPGGTLILSCPNFRKLHFFLHWFIDKKNLRRHVIDAMDLKKWKKILTDNGMQIKWQGYYKTAEFWGDSNDQTYIERVITKRLTFIMDKIDSRIRFPNRFLSPYIISVSFKIT